MVDSTIVPSQETSSLRHFTGNENEPLIDDEIEELVPGADLHTSMHRDVRVHLSSEAVGDDMSNSAMVANQQSKSSLTIKRENFLKEKKPSESSECSSGGEGSEPTEEDNMLRGIAIPIILM